MVSLEEATAICEGAGRTAEEYGRFPPLASSAELLYSKHSTSSSGGEADDGGSGGGGALGTGGREGEGGGALKRCSISDGKFADFLMGLFAEVDTDGKVRRDVYGVINPVWSKINGLALRRIFIEVSIVEKNTEKKLKGLISN